MFPLTGFPFCLHIDRFEIKNGQRRQQFFQPTAQQVTAAAFRSSVRTVRQKMIEERKKKKAMEKKPKP